MRSHLYPILTCLLLLISACGGGSSSSNSESVNFDFSGTWEVRYNALEALTQMTCGNLFGEDSFAFIDTHEISQSGATITLTAKSQVIIGTGEVDESGELTAVEILSGDLFGDGRMCTLTLTVSYQNVVENRAETLFLQSLSCSDGLICEDQAFGIATKANA
ncbi:MAG: hypothetical protein KDD62_15020 [Bdellovibrionales bacterium]|nr:hypothetical protein [Bdellovibrionales bacterium]